MIGLRDGSVVVTAHDPGWDEAFAREEGRLRAQLDELVDDVQHVGSTAVPGLPAKPIIDIALVLVDGATVARIRDPLLALGYIAGGDSGADGGYIFVKKSAPDISTHHLHVVARDDLQWRTWLAFRDRLRADSALRVRYAALKYHLMRRFPADRAAYTAGKHDFIRAAAQHSR